MGKLTLTFILVVCVVAVVGRPMLYDDIEEELQRQRNDEIRKTKFIRVLKDFIKKEVQSDVADEVAHDTVTVKDAAPCGYHDFDCHTQRGGTHKLAARLQNMGLPVGL